MAVSLALAPATLAAAEAAGPEQVPLELQLPRPRFVGTPSTIRSPYLEKPAVGRRPPVLVSAGAANLALGKPVTASDPQPIMGSLSQLTDGDREGIEGSYVEIGPGRQYFQVDLQSPCRIDVIVLWHYHNQARVYRDVVVQLAADPDFTTDVRTVFNNDRDNSSGLGVGTDPEYIDSFEGRLIETHGQRARYVRLYSNGNTDNDLNHGTEVEVYGTR